MRPELPSVLVTRRGRVEAPEPSEIPCAPLKRWDYVWVVVYQGAHRGPGAIVSWAGDFQSDDEAVRVVESNLQLTVHDKAVAALWRGFVLGEPIAEWCVCSGKRPIEDWSDPR